MDQSELFCKIHLIHVRALRNMARKVKPHLIHLLQLHASHAGLEIKQDAEPATV